MWIEVLDWYLIGVVVAVVITLLFNVCYTAKGRLSSVKWVDLLLALLSWICVVVEVVLIISEAKRGFPSYGEDYDAKSYDRFMAKFSARMMNDMYPEVDNNASLIALRSTKTRELSVEARKLIHEHIKNGCAIVGATIGENELGTNDINELNRVNDQRAKDLLVDIQKVGYCYTPWCSLFEINGKFVYKKAFIVYADKRDGDTDMAGLKDFAITMGDKYMQKAVGLKEPGKDYNFYSSGVCMKWKLSGANPIDEVGFYYFYKFQVALFSGAFRYRGVYVLPKPCSDTEAKIRCDVGEVLVD